MDILESGAADIPEGGASQASKMRRQAFRIGDGGAPCYKRKSSRLLLRGYLECINALQVHY